MSRKVKGMTTIEMAYIMPIVLLTFITILYITFYFHDKNVLTGMAYETALIGTQKERTLAGLKEEELSEFFHQHADAKLILFANPRIKVSKNKDYVTANVRADRKHMNITVEARASVMEPEKYIRQIRKVK